MALDLHQVITELEPLTTAELGRRYAELFGEAAPTRHRHRLVRRILWRLQALEEGDLSERARRRARELADEAQLRLTPPGPMVDRMPQETVRRDPRLPRPGSVITRRYKDRLIEVAVTADGFRYEGRRYRSLSAVAKAITGSHLNGFQFFALGSRQKKKGA